MSKRYKQMSVNPQNELPFCQIFNGNMMQYLFSMHSSLIPAYSHGKSCTLGTSLYLWRRGRRGAPNRNVFLGKNFADPTIKKSKFFFTQPQISIKNEYPPLAKNFTKGYHSVIIHFLSLLL
jgi:hypothetical protein